ncbi:MAG: DUF1080 domain-containing protein [Planctomycetes bacterium]|nr:DUF1080 domain-containing protein [Planctomycetota bacterium]
MTVIPASASGADEEGFVSLFDGKTTDGWRGYRKPMAPAGWVVEDGALARKGGGGDLLSKDKFGDFELRFEWKVSPGANSGVMYRVSETEGASYMTGPEYQVLDNAKHHDGRSPLTSAAALYALYPADQAVTKPVGQYNEARIVVKGQHVEHWLNGKKVVETEINGDDWNKRIAASKFKGWKKFGQNSEGHIVIQDHGDPVWYRNIRIKKL